MTKRQLVAKLGPEDFALVERAIAARKTGEFSAVENKRVEKVLKLVRQLNAAQDRK